MRLFLSYAWTDEDEAVVTARLRQVIDVVESCGVEVYFNQDDPDTTAFSAPGEYIKDAIKKMADCDGLIIIKSSERRSEGQLMEIGAAIAMQKPLHVFVHESARGSTHLTDPHLSNTISAWNTDEELLSVIKKSLSLYM